jgi:hypothetical protein
MPRGHFGGPGGAQIVVVRRSRPHAEPAGGRLMTGVKRCRLRQCGGGGWRREQPRLAQIHAPVRPVGWLGA